MKPPLPTRISQFQLTILKIPLPQFSPVNIRVYHPPVVLIHGLWGNPTGWTQNNFFQNLTKNYFNVTLADYGKHNATTFDPYANKTFGNYGINATR
jgi:pimeloyl-ACP methyl ester carboxylesterase